MHHFSYRDGVLHAEGVNLATLADAVETGQSTFHWGYVAKAFAYAIGYVGAALTVAVILFEDRELG